MLAIARHEIRGLLGSPAAWCVLASMQLVLGVFVFLRLLIGFVEQQPALVAANSSAGITAVVVSPLLNTTVLVMLLLLPLLSMRSISEERRTGSFVLLQSAPCSLAAIVFGKFLALLAFVLLALTCISLLPLSLLFAGHLDYGLLGAGLLAVLLSGACFAAIGLAASTLTTQPAMAGLIGVLLLLALWSIDPTVSDSASNTPGQIVGWLALRPHLEPMLRGLVRGVDVAYFLILSGWALGLAIWRLESIRLHG
ncbi:MAG: ABC transporter permease subunit [Gammaproteobacteria bacterium]|nr:ABC transporter permease subunit [Gammaproteobacteria bacterium]